MSRCRRSARYRWGRRCCPGPARPLWASETGWGCRWGPGCRSAPAWPWAKTWGLRWVFPSGWGPALGRRFVARRRGWPARPGPAGSARHIRLERAQRDPGTLGDELEQVGSGLGAAGLAQSAGVAADEPMPGLQHPDAPTHIDVDDDGVPIDDAADDRGVLIHQRSPAMMVGRAKASTKHAHAAGPVRKRYEAISRQTAAR